MKKVKNTVLLGALSIVLLILWSRNEGGINEKIKGEIDSNKVELEKLKQELVSNANGQSPNNLEERLHMELLSYEEKVMSMLCSMPDCPADCDVCCNLPYNMKKGKFMVHHVFTERDPWIWNQEYRFINMSLDKDSTVVYVGANTWGGDGKQIMDMFNCTIHMFEPVPSFFEELTGHWKGYKAELGFDATLYKFGLGSNDRTIHLAPEDLGIDGGLGTFGMVDSEGNAKIPLKIREGATVIRDIMTDPDTQEITTVDLLHVNCEGCEWEMFENLIETGVMQTIRSMQFSSHYFSPDQVPNLLARYCKIKEHLSKTHYMVYGQSFGWERWDLKE